MAGRRNIYQGPSSCYARSEGVWVPGSGVTPETLPSFIALIVRDMHRGLTYDGACRPVKADPSFLIKRLDYLVALTKKHAGEVAKTYTKEALERLYREHRLPPGVSKIRLAGYRGRLDKVAGEVEDLLQVKVEKEYREEPAALVGQGRKALAVIG